MGIDDWRIFTEVKITSSMQIDRVECEKPQSQDVILILFYFLLWLGGFSHSTLSILTGVTVILITMFKYSSM